MDVSEKWAMLYIAIACLLAVNFVLPTAVGGDFQTHYIEARDGCSSIDIDCVRYAPLFRFLESFFAFHENAFKYFALIVIGVLTPLVLFKLSDSNPVAVLLFFSATSYFYYFIDGIYPQALAMLLALGILLSKNKYLDILLLIFSILAHSQGFMLSLLVLIAKNIPTGFLCSGIFGNNEPSILTTPTGLSSGGFDFHLKDILHFFTITFPIPFLYWSIKKAVANKKIGVLFLVGVSFALGFFVSPRTFYFIPLVLIPELSGWYSVQEKTNQRLFLLLLAFSGAMQFYLYWNFKTNCV